MTGLGAEDRKACQMEHSKQLREHVKGCAACKSQMSGYCAQARALYERIVAEFLARKG